MSRPFFIGKAMSGDSWQDFKTTEASEANHLNLCASVSHHIADRKVNQQVTFIHQGTGLKNKVASA